MTIIRVVRRISEEDQLYRSSPFEFPETATPDQCLVRVGRLATFGQKIVVKTSTEEAPQAFSSNLTA